ncbi:MAG: hypothetical protein IJI43_02270 [Bacilli bacterium]|nr:hypothetical protein [Bacilli bacterium]MBQ6539019.1 hypothetical protein [Bacilli bacterium]
MNKKVLNWCLCISFIIILILVILVVLFLKSPKEVVTKKLDGGNISLTYTDDFNGLTVKKCVPLNDNRGKTLDSADLFFDFSITSELKDANKIDYEISVKKDTTLSTTLDENIRVYLEEEKDDKYVPVFGPETYLEGTEKTKLGTDVGYMPILKVKKTANSTDKYRLRVWLYDKAVFDKKAIQTITMKVYVNGKAS